jgi:hypothetical protein
MAAQILAGVKGMSRLSIPSGARASITAFTIAGVDPIVPASPIPFAPRGFSGVAVSV